ncbi:MAG: seg [Microgenomates group bacterium GW2011_GWC1_41_20]|uniref:Lipid A core-O-antigen ligase-like protein enyme n=5 Tax=Candidatus Woeseibacteriota TaxID=1752722 RepID=A0A0G0Z797_9BACT|nr:MAG: Lipid A core-O-antigen ligase-like protein enyme [Candidatus Woesebacteria bacterium GW2011_GWB1_40_12]KKR90318.1 MAG: Lipid A core-O-antigen ligase-like protein enyme [Candidatus Woesebacteria bacterium GW2011_GWD1_41_12]KKS00117.1 MAG: seg [Microgenomates group bacterium GW2011_GWC1_41_20]KKS17996.1 MAG: Lipid A core-O-antigen ligase-like protein enyme [Candidatus Woesebacteria bacterium GW2011_GWA1_41_7]OGM81768.1 MAG: hypothetical protein A2393_03120 [Candidatus Woesebacteria bacter
MIPILRLLEKYLNLFLVFLFPTQLALHFWPDFAFVFGIRVDYLSPAIYLTDLLFVILLVPWLVKERHNFLRDLGNSKKLLLLFLLILLANLLITSAFWISLIKWTKIIEMILVAYYVNKRKDIFTVSKVSTILFCSLLFFSIIGILQFFLGRTLGGIFYWLGERTFSIFTPGIASVNLFGKNFLRIYSTFPHPNALAGFIGLTAIFLIFNRFISNKVLMTFGYLLISVVFILAFSMSAYIAFFICIILYFVFKLKIFNQKALTLFIVLMSLLSFYLTIFSKPLLQSGINFSKSFRERLVLANISGEMISENWVVGAGLNTFIIKETVYGNLENSVWLLQPVHNIYLLVLTEVGLSGIILLSLVLYRFLKNCIKSKNIWGVLSIIFILTTGLFDHYWFTIQQNMLLISLLLGLSLREK